MPRGPGRVASPPRGAASRAARAAARCLALALWLAALPARAYAEPTATEAAAPIGQPGELPQGQSKVRVFAGADGLRNLVILSLAQDDDGFLWIGTEDGVYRFDGEWFTHFSVEDGLSSSQVHVVGIAPGGRACVGSSNGLVCWDGARFSRQHTLGLPAIPVQTMATFGGKLWVGTDGGGLYVQNDAGLFVPAPGWPGAPKTTVRAMWSDGSGLVVGNGATVELSAGDGVWRNIGDVGLDRDRVEGVLRDRKGALWIRTPGHMWFLPPGASHATDLREGLPTGFDATGAPNAMTIGPRDDVLIAADDGIAYRDHGRWRTLGPAAGLPAATTRAVLVDREGTIWIGSAGLFQLRGRGLIEHYNLASGLPGEIVWTFLRDRRGTLWAGTNRCLARAVAGRWECLPSTFGRVVRSVVLTPSGGMFIGGAPSDLLYIDPDGHTTPFGERDPDHNIIGLALGPEGDLWVGTKVGLYRLPGATPGTLERVVVPGTGPNTRFGSILVVGDQLWVTAAPGGVAVLDHGAWHVFDATHGFRDSSMSVMAARRDGRLCAAYSEAIGLTCFRYDGHRVTDLTHIGVSDGPTTGLTTGMVYFLGEDRAQRLWVGTGGGVDVLTTAGIDHFDDSDGLAGNDSATKAFLLDDDGSVWLGATGGASHVYAQYYRGPPVPPRTFLGGRLGDRPIRDVRVALEVPHDRNALTLEFAAGTLLDPKRVQYQVRLSPLETAWNASKKSEAHYPALLPGSYRFEVRARIDTGPWGPPSELGFAVRPAWWQTRWFLVLFALAALTAVGGGFTWRQRAILGRRTRQLHAQSDASFRAVIDLMPDLLAVYRDAQLIYLNQAHRRFLGLDRPGDGWASIDLLDWVHPDDRAQFAELLTRVGSLPPQQATEIIELRMKSADGSWRACEVSGILVEIAGALTVVASGRDVTERKRLRAQLLVSDRMASLGTLAAGIAHEINNPLAYVTGNLEAVSETLRTSPATAGAAGSAGHAELNAAISEARDGAERVRKIVQGLRLFSRSEEEQRVPLALSGVIEAAIRLTGNEVRHRAQLVRELGPVPLVVADDSRLTQVFINLLVNAAHAIPEGRSDKNRITIRTRTDEQGRAVIEVEDTGKGIAPDLVSRVFDPFFTTKDVGGGTGLGLSICHGIISGLGGQITIESGPPRIGTVVRVVLPPAGAAASAPASAAPDVDPPAASETRRRVLLVDDEPLVAHTMERLLRRDYDITVALCGQDALDHIVGGAQFDAIISDVMMPNMTGIELLEELRRIAPDQAQRLIFLSGGAFTARTRERLDELGVLQLEKPVTARELRASVKRITGEPEPPA
ncbi:MAG TPA: ATP-binding protein [Kofleriaceae bacterium]|nr:ATP-binding protein [Kofleriaceae bacterium]